jgi:3-oxoacyl-[acyl-carrier-protein] synthase II
MADRPTSVAITGLGAVSAAGLDIAATLASFRAEHRCPGKLTLFESPVDCPVFEAGGFPATRPYSDGVRTQELALHALREALDEARLDDVALKGARVGVCLGTTVASQLNDLEFYRSFKSTGAAEMAPVRRYLKGNLADAVAAHLGVTALTATVTNACSSGADAIAIGAQWIEGGLCDIVIAGGADELSRIPYCGFNALGLGCPFPCTPFDKNRRGLNLGEGAGILFLESAVSASARGFTPRLALCGHGSACDAHHLTAPHPEGIGLRSALNQALTHARVRADEIAFVNAHGTGTQDNDLIEGNALAAIFGPAIPTLSTKGFTGHTLGAAGGLEAVFTGLGLREGWLPPSAGFQEQDERIPITPLRVRTEVTGCYAISTSLAFGGNNTALLLGLLE